MKNGNFLSICLLRNIIRLEIMKSIIIISLIFLLPAFTFSQSITDKMFLAAIEAENEKEMIYWLERGADINVIVPNTNLNALQIVVSKDNRSLVDLVLKKGFNIKACNTAQTPPIIVATLNCNFEIVYLLCRYGANLNDADENGLRAVDYAKNNGCVRIEKLLSKHIYNENNSFKIYYNSYTDYLQKQDYENALIQAEKAKAVMETEFDKTKNSIWPSIILKNLASLYFYEHNYHKAEPLLIESIDLHKRIMGENDLDYIESINLLANLYQKIGNYYKAEELYKECIKKYKLENIFDSNYATFCSNLGVLYLQLDNYDSAEIFLKEAIEVQEKTQGVANREYAVLLNNLSNLYSRQGNLAEAEKLSLKACDIFKQVTGKNNLDYAQQLSNTGRLYSNIGNYKESESYLIESLNLYKKLGAENNPDYVYNLSFLASLYSDLGIYLKAEKYYVEALQIQRNIFGENHPEYANSLNNLALLYSILGNYRDAEQYYLKALKIQENVIGKNSVDYANTLDNLACFYRNFQSYEKEILPMEVKLWDIAKSLYSKTDPIYINQENSIKGIYYWIKKYSECDSLFLEALKIKDNLLGNKHPSYATTLNNLAGYYEEIGNFNNAEKMYLEAKKIYEESYGLNHPLYFTAISNLSGLYWKKSDLNKGEPLFLDYCEYQKSLILNSFSFLSSSERELNWNNKEQPFFNVFYPSFSYLYSREQPFISTFAYDNELFSKGLLLNTSVEIQNVVLQSGDTALMQIWEELRSLRVQADKMKQRPLSEQYGLDSLETRAEALDKEMTKRSALYRENKESLQIKWQDVQKNLKADEAAIEFVAFDYFREEYTDTVLYYALVLRKESEYPTLVPLFEESQLNLLLADKNADTEKRIGKLYNSGSPRFYNGQKLYGLVWQPLEEYLSGIETVYYSPSGLLNQISFAAIPADTLLLGDKYNLRLLSSTREIVRIKKKEDAFLPLRQAVVYGGIPYDVEQPETLIQSAQRYKTEETQYFASRSLPMDSTRSGWRYLQGTKEEVVEIETILQQSKVSNSTITGISANEESFKNLSGDSPELLHVATHGFFLQDEKQIRETGFMQLMGANENRRHINPLLRSGLLFAGANRAWKNENVISGIEDGILTAEEISRLNLSQTKLVVLSACETGLGEVQNSEGVFGLQRAFKLAGVETLVMSLWKVDDNATSKFMITFYQNLMAGSSKLESFKTAQQAIREEYKNPYYWAGFVMMD